jgi:hypothetical protein
MTDGRLDRIAYRMSLDFVASVPLPTNYVG